MNKNKFFRILKYFKPFNSLIIIAAVSAILVNISQLSNPYIIKIVIDDFFAKGNFGAQIQYLAFLYLFIAVIGSILNYSQGILLNTIVQKIMHNIRMELFSHIQKMRLSYFDSNSSGRILTRVTNDVEALNEMYSSVLVGLFKDFFMILGVIAVMLQLSLKLSLISFSVIPIIIFATYFYNKKAVFVFKQIRSLIAQINGFFAENISGMKLVQIFNRQKEKYAEFEKLNQAYNEKSRLDVFLMSIFRPCAEFINTLGISLLIWYCTPKIFGGTLEVGVLFAFISYIKMFFNPINDLTDTYNVILSGIVSADRIFEIIDNTIDLEDSENGMPISNIKGEIEFKNVWFAYKNEDWILKDITFKINSGETVAFVGSTGAGKSTIINLISRFYDIQKGEILIDGINIKKIKLSDLRKLVAVVMQDVFLFSGNIQSNIKLNSTNISDSDVFNACEYVNALDFVNSLPGKFEAEVKERGCTFSSGQRQLLSFARAVAFNPSILVLDEATANIDTETEKVIQNSLEKISKDRTTIVIAHRLSTIQNADKIIVIHKGRIREMGKHNELLEKDGIYKHLYDIQYAN
jgi:ATP-binding cassette subfamily B protein